VSVPPFSCSPYGDVVLLVDADAQAALRSRAERAGVDTMTMDHGYCVSRYLNDPNGLVLELAVDHPEVDKIDAIQRENAHCDLARWLSGDHSDNNDWRSKRMRRPNTTQTVAWDC
jgi:glyoxylase I family protein